MNVEINNDIVMDASLLRSNNIQKRLVKELILEILKRLQQELLTAQHEGKYHIITSLPITFDIPNMVNKDSQRLIWSSVIEYLVKKKYRIWINPTNNNCKIKITWINIQDEAEINMQNNIIIKHTKNI